MMRTRPMPSGDDYPLRLTPGISRIPRDTRIVSFEVDPPPLPLRPGDWGVRGWSAVIVAVIVAGALGYAAALYSHGRAVGGGVTTVTVTANTTVEPVTITVTKTITVTGASGPQGQPGAHGPQGQGGGGQGNAGKMSPEAMRERLAQELQRECSACHAPPSVDEIEVIPGPMRPTVGFNGTVMMVKDFIAVLRSPNGTIIHAVKLPILCSVKPGDAVEGVGQLAMRLVNQTGWMLVKVDECRVEKTG